MRSFRLLTLLALVFAVLVPAAGAGWSGTAHAATAVISLNPNAFIAPSGSVAIGGVDFTPNSHVTVKIDTTISSACPAKNNLHRRAGYAPSGR